MKNLEILKRLLAEAEEEETKVDAEASEEETIEEPKPGSFEADPMEFILKKYHGLNELMIELMTKDFQEYVDGIFIMAPKPTTFKIQLHNGQFFFLVYLGKAYEATIEGKKYYLMGLGEKERCMTAIARLLRFGTPLKTQGPEGAEQATREEDNTGMEGDWAAKGGATGGMAPEAGGGEVDTTADTGGEELTESIRLIKAILIKEAFTDFPKSEKEISDKKIKALFKVLKTVTNIEDPISLDPNKSNVVNVTRKLQKDKKAIIAIKKLTGQDISINNTIKWDGLTVKFGEGSRGGRGVKSKGPKFEQALAEDLKKISKKGLDEDNLDAYSHPKLISEITEELGLEKGNFTVQFDASKNQPRPLTFLGDGPEVSFSGKSIAATLTDITINKEGGPYYISAKYGSTLTFFNSGVTKIFPKEEIQAGKIKNKNGVILLETLGIDNKSFCAIFNYYAKGEVGEFKPKQISADIPKLQNLVSSGIGSGYYYAQAGKGEDLFFFLDEEYNEKASTITTATKVYYSGIKGDAKRIDVLFESEKYKFKINIRNKQGGIYPSHIMCDYIAK